MKSTVVSDVAAFLVPLLIALGFPACVLAIASSQGLKLALQDLGFTVFLVTCLPLSAMCFVRALDLRLARSIGSRERTLWIVTFTLLSIGVITASAVDATRPPFIPYGMINAEEEIAKVAALREQVTRSEDLEATAEQLRRDFDSLRSSQGFASLREYWGGTNFVALYALALNVIVILYCLCFLLYLGFKILHPDRRGPAFKSRLNELIVAFSVLTLWFPLRVYSEWYNNFYSLEGLIEFQALLPMLAALIIGLFLLAAYARPESVVKWFKTVNGAVAVLVGAVFAWNPAAMHFATRFLAATGWVTWLLTGAILVSGVFLVGKAIKSLP